MNPEEMPQEPKTESEHSPDERWLEETLARYAAVEPRTGLENRILANLEARASNRRRTWKYAFVGAAAVALFVVMILNRRNAGPNIAGNLAARQDTPSEAGHSQATSSNTATAVAMEPRKASTQLAHVHRALQQKNMTRGKAMLQAAKVRPKGPGDATLPQPADEGQMARQETEPGIAEQRPAAEIYISDLGAVAPIEIKELPVRKSRN